MKYVVEFSYKHPSAEFGAPEIAWSQPALLWDTLDAAQLFATFKFVGGFDSQALTGFRIREHLTSNIVVECFG